MTTGDGPQTARILVVEDEYLIADDIAMTLEDLGYAVVGPVATVAEALAVIRSGLLDAALLDANLDGESNSPVAAALAARGAPFIVVTGYGGLTLGPAILNDAPRVAKPLRASDLASRLAETLGR